MICDDREKTEQILDTDMKKIHQMQYLDRILSTGCSPVAPKSVTVVIDDSKDNIYFKDMMEAIRQNAAWARCVRMDVLSVADVRKHHLTQITKPDTILIIDDTEPIVLTPYQTYHFGGVESVYYNVGVILEAALMVNSHAELSFKDEPTVRYIDNVPDHIVVLTNDDDMEFISRLNSYELECSVRVIDLRGMCCEGVLDSSSTICELFKGYDYSDDRVVFTDWKPPTYYEFMRSKGKSDETSC